MNIQIINKYKVSVIQDREYITEFEFSVEDFIDQLYGDHFEDNDELEESIRQYILEDSEHIYDFKELQDEDYPIELTEESDDLQILNISEISALPELQALIMAESCCNKMLWGSKYCSNCGKRLIDNVED